MEGRAAVASAIAMETATTERGPPGFDALIHRNNSSSVLGGAH